MGGKPQRRKMGKLLQISKEKRNFAAEMKEKG
jgi:hypothetical protein